jgi:vacuolar-type H+-ATPase subunit H
MKEIVNKILQEEEQTRKKIQAVEQEANQMLVQARKEAQEVIADTLRQTKLSVTQKQEESEAAFLAEKDTLLAEAREKTAALRQAREKDMDDIAVKVFTKIIEIKDS